MMTKPSLKRQRSGAVEYISERTTSQQEQVELNRLEILESCVCVRDQPTAARLICCMSRITNDFYNPSNCDGRKGRSFRTILLALKIFLLSILSTSWVVVGKPQRLSVHHSKIPQFQNRRNLSRLREEWGDGQGDQKFLNDNWDSEISLMYNENHRQNSHSFILGRELSGEALERFIEQQNRNNEIEEKIEEKLPSALRSGVGVENLNSIGSPHETNVSSSFSSMLDYGDSIKKNNPLIKSKLPIEFQLKVLVKDTMTSELLNGLKRTLQGYIERKYRELITFDSKTLKLEEVDLTVSLINSTRWQGRHLRRLDCNFAHSTKGSLRSQTRIMQREGQSSTKLMTIDVDGSVNYSMEVDGSVPTPDDIEKQWKEAYSDITSPNELRRAIEEAGIEGLLRLEQVTTKEDPSDQSENGSTETSNANSGTESTSDTEKLSSLYEDNFDESSENLSEKSSDENINENNSSKKTSQLERPSTLSIVFGFILTGIAVLGLFGYAYLFYRKRQKHLKKKRKMKESITFSSANVAVAAAASASTRNQNSQYYSKNTPHSTSYPANASTPYQVYNSAMLSQSVSEETSYKGLESSIGSEDVSDPFANELKLAASLDQEAWNESQLVKEKKEKRQVNRLRSSDHMISTNPKSPVNASVPSLLSNGPINLEEDRVNTTATEANLEVEWVKSFPYGDEAQPVGVENDNESDMQSSPSRWEPYNSALPPLLEEKKSETNPSDFFSQKLRDIERDLTDSRKTSANRSRTEPEIIDDVGATSDIVSEVSELSRYVRKYERRKDRKLKREEYLHERRSIDGGAQSYSSPSNKISNGMDGHADSALRKIGRSRDNESSSRRMKPTPLSSYTESFIDAQKHGTSIVDSMSFVSDDEDNEEDASMRSERLGISPYRRSNNEIYYQNGTLQSDVNPSLGRVHLSPSRAKSTRTEDDYRNIVGYRTDHSRSASNRLANLRANNAIIDSSNSDVNLHFNASSKPHNGDHNNNSWSAAKKGSGIPTPDNTRVNMSNNTKAVVSATTDDHIKKPKASNRNKRFDKLRGLFEQKTNEQPEPVFPPGENWQHAGSLGTPNKHHYVR